MTQDENENRTRVQCRDKALLARIGVVPSTGRSRSEFHNLLAADMNIFGAYMNEHMDFRKILYWALFAGETDMTQHGKQIRSLSSIVLEYTGMTTVHLAYKFLMECTTEAHTVQEVVTQSEKLEGVWKAGELKHGDLWKYHFILHGPEPQLSNALYPELIYCAIEYNKRNTGRTWEQFNLKQTTLRNKTTLSNKVGIKTC